jgi:hypothetical protein
MENLERSKQWLLFFPTGLNQSITNCLHHSCTTTNVSDPGKGVCADPVNGGAILGKGGPDPHSRDKERQLAPDKGRGKT